MNKYKKMYKGLSLEELQSTLETLKQEEEELRAKREERFVEGAIEDYVGDKRFFKDMGWVSLGIFAFQASQVFLCRPIPEPTWVNYAIAGLCAVASALTIVATRKGFEKDKAKCYAERKTYYLTHKEEVDEFAKNAPRYDEQLYLEINIDKQIAVSELISEAFEKSGPIFPELTR